LKSLNCPNCGGKCIQSNRENVITCTYCGNEFEKSSSSEESVFCECGRSTYANCTTCGTPLCENHALTLNDFNIVGIATDKISNLGKTAAQIYSTDLISRNGSDTLFCSKCIDKLLEDWLKNMYEIGG